MRDDDTLRYQERAFRHGEERLALDRRHAREAIREFHASREMALYYRNEEEAALQDAVKEQLERCLCIDLRWEKLEVYLEQYARNAEEYDSVTAAVPPDGRLVLMDAAAKQLAAEDRDGRILFLSADHSRHFFDGKRSGDRAAFESIVEFRDRAALSGRAAFYSDCPAAGAKDNVIDRFIRPRPLDEPRAYASIEWDGQRLRLNAVRKTKDLRMDWKSRPSDGNPGERDIYLDGQAVDRNGRNWFQGDYTWIFRCFDGDGNPVPPHGAAVDLRPVELWEQLWKRGYLVWEKRRDAQGNYVF